MRIALLACTTLLIAACRSDSPSPTDPGNGNGNGSGNGNGAQIARAGIYVTTQTNSVLVFPLNATGNVAPSRRIVGDSTGLSLPIGVGVDSKGSVYVANRTGSRVTVYPIGADGNVAPTRSLVDTAMRSPQALVVDRTDAVFVASCPGCGSAAGGATAMFHFPNNANAADYVLRGTNTQLSYPVGIAVDATRNVYIGNAFGGTVNVFAPGASGNSIPIRSFNPGASQNVQSLTVAGNTILLTSPGIGILSYISTATAGTPPAATIPSSATLPIVYPGGSFLDTSVPQPVLYLVDYSGGAVHIIQTNGTAPNLGVQSVATIRGALTGLSLPLSITVVK